MYGRERYVDDATHLSSVVVFDRPWLGDLTGLRTVHLQCPHRDGHAVAGPAPTSLNWLPSARHWARIVAGLLAPGGRLYLREGHPMLGTLEDDRDDRRLVVEHPYFETAEPNRWESPTSYTGDGPLAEPVTYEWNHGIAEVVQAVLDAGLTLTRLAEQCELEWAFWPWMATTARGTYVLPERPDRLPLMYSLEATKPG